VTGAVAVAGPATGTADVVVRPAQPADGAGLLRLMTLLAHFEGYAGQFRVRESDLHTRGPGSARPEFEAWVAEAPDGTLIGHAVCVRVDFTLDLRPTIVLKEFYVDEAHRGSGVATALFDAVQRAARAAGAGRLQWLVLPGNERARRFYRARGGFEDRAWERWSLPLDAGSVNPACSDSRR